MSDNLADLARRCREICVFHHFAGEPTPAVEYIDGGGITLRSVPGDEHFTILAQKAWGGAALRGDGRTVEEAVRNLHA